MIVAIPLFGSEVSPRFDCAKEFQFIRVEGGKVAARQKVQIGETNPLQRAKLLRDRKVDKLICGGIDGFSTRMLSGLGIHVFPWVAGDAEQALKNFLKNEKERSWPEGAQMEIEKDRSPHGAVLVVGAGVAGLQSALDLANSGFFVYLVEKSAGIGGVMAQLDKTFPTNECSM